MVELEPLHPPMAVATPIPGCAKRQLHVLDHSLTTQAGAWASHTMASNRNFKNYLQPRDTVGTHLSIPYLTAYQSRIRNGNGSREGQGQVHGSAATRGLELTTGRLLCKRRGVSGIIPGLSAHKVNHKVMQHAGSR
jgi:hypothetical protein